MNKSKLPIIYVQPNNSQMYDIDIAKDFLKNNTMNNGDLLIFEHSYRGDATYIYYDDKLQNILQDGAGYSFIIPKILNYNLNDDNINEIINCYKIYVNIIIYPLEYQHNNLKISSNNMLKEVYGYNCDENIEGILDIDSGITEFNYTQIFDPDNYYENVD